jgi:hypothetical protein
MSDAALGWVVLLVLVVAGSVTVTLWWVYRIRSNSDEFYRRLHEKEQRGREAGPPGI